MAVSISGDGAVTGVASINTDVSSTELGYLDGVTSAIQPQIAGAGGLVLVGQSSFSAVSSVSLDNVFSSTYSDYRIIFKAVGSAQTNVRMRLRLSGTDATTNYSYHYWDPAGNGSSTSVMGFSFIDTTIGISDCLVLGPAIAADTGWVIHHGRSGNQQNVVGRHSTATAYDGMSLVMDTGTMTGTVRVYGYAQ